MRIGQSEHDGESGGMIAVTKVRWDADTIEFMVLHPTRAARAEFPLTATYEALANGELPELAHELAIALDTDFDWALSTVESIVCEVITQVVIPLLCAAVPV